MAVSTLRCHLNAPFASYHSCPGSTVQSVRTCMLSLKPNGRRDIGFWSRNQEPAWKGSFQVAERRLCGQCRGRLKCTAAQVVTEVEDGKSVSKPSFKRVVGRGSRFVGCGSAVPKNVISNDDLSKLVDTSDEWIATRTGIRSRRVLIEGESLVSLAVESCRKALEMAKVEPNDVDMILLCTSTPEDIFGGAGAVQAGLGITSKCLVYDTTAACSGFVVGLVQATRWIYGGGYENILVVGADALSRFVDWTDRGTCILFGDGSGAVLVQAAPLEEPDNLLGFDMHSDGMGGRHLHASIGTENLNGAATVNGSAFGCLPQKGRYNDIFMNGREVFRFAVKAVPQVVEGALQEAGLSVADVDWLLLHQANQRILDAAAERLGVSREKVISNLANYGNTSAASIPLALDEAVRAGNVKPGQVVATAGFGAGLTWASAVIRWG